MMKASIEQNVIKSEAITKYFYQILFVVDGPVDERETDGGGTHKVG